MENSRHDEHTYSRHGDSKEWVALLAKTLGKRSKSANVYGSFVKCHGFSRLCSGLALDGVQLSLFGSESHFDLNPFLAFHTGPSNDGDYWARMMYGQTGPSSALENPAAMMSPYMTELERLTMGLPSLPEDGVPHQGEGHHTTLNEVSDRSYNLLMERFVSVIVNRMRYDFSEVFGDKLIDEHYEEEPYSLKALRTQKGGTVVMRIEHRPTIGVLITLKLPNYECGSSTHTSVQIIYYRRAIIPPLYHTYSSLLGDSGPLRFVAFRFLTLLLAATDESPDVGLAAIQIRDPHYLAHFADSFGMYFTNAAMNARESAMTPTVTRVHSMIEYFTYELPGLNVPFYMDDDCSSTRSWDYACKSIQFRATVALRMGKHKFYELIKPGMCPYKLRLSPDDKVRSTVEGLVAAKENFMALLDCARDETADNAHLEDFPPSGPQTLFSRAGDYRTPHMT